MVSHGADDYDGAEHGVVQVAKPSSPKVSRPVAIVTICWGSLAPADRFLEFAKAKKVEAPARTAFISHYPPMVNASRYRDALWNVCDNDIS